MGTRGYFAYRYKKKYYRQYISNSAYPSGFGVGYADDIPQDAEERKAWVDKTISMIEKQIAYRAKHGVLNRDACGKFSDIRDDIDWTLGSLFIEWTYVIDLDNQLFTVNGASHFRFGNIPDVTLLEGGSTSTAIPPEHFATVSLWADPNFNVDEVQREYDGHSPMLVSASEWGAPTWSTLSVAQHLSAQLVCILVQDCSHELLLAEFPRIHRQIGLFCWRMVTSAAPSALLCPPDDSPPSSNVTHVAADRSIKQQIPTVGSRMIGKGFLGRYCWFRNCLVTFCVRLDELAFVAHEVNKMILKLRDKGRTSGVGLVVSSWQVVAVSVNGSEVRHSPALAIHDNKEELKEGLLLMVHLLSPMLPGVPKTPWAEAPSFQSTNSNTALPYEILEHIVHFTDFDTYLQIPVVSQRFREICLSRPRVGKHTLIAKESGTDPVFRTQSTACGTGSVMTLARIKPVRAYPGQREPRRYRLHRITAGAINPGLAGSFQYLRIGQQSSNTTDEIVQKLETNRAWGYRAALAELDWRVAAAPTVVPEIRIQVLDGVWRMFKDMSEVPVPEEPPESVQGSSYDLHRWYSRREDYVGIWYDDSDSSEYDE